MRKFLAFAAFVLSIGFFVMACGSKGGQSECSGDQDCITLHGQGYYCDITDRTCKCAPQCIGKCGGPDGCGGSGSCPNNCPAGQTCNPTTFICEGTCTKQCTGKCGGPDGCGGNCQNTCPAGQSCQAPGYTQCGGTCTPNCTGKCGGPDSCGGNCQNTCPTGQSCQAPSYTQCGGTCTPNCTGKCGGPDTCGGTCPNNCTTGQTCNPTTFVCEGTCTPNCTGKVCGSDGCGTQCQPGCPAGQACNETGQCTAIVAHTGAGQACKCDPAGQTCSTPCPTTAGAAVTCILTDDQGNGFCSFACSVNGADGECQVDFPEGCCRTGSNPPNAFCLKPEFCGGAGDQDYLEQCGTAEFGNCKEQFTCIGGFNPADQFGYCFYPCTYPGGTCQDSGTCMATTVQGQGFCVPPGPNQHGAFCTLPLDGCVAGLKCLYAANDSQQGYCGGECDCTSGTGCPAGAPAPECALQLQGTPPTCICGYKCTTTADCPGGATGWQCYSLGQYSVCLAL